jgi:hypothetical protein
MRIHGTLTTLAAAARSGAGVAASGADAAFASQLAAGSARLPRAGSVRSVASLTPLAGMLAVQQLSIPGEGRRRAIRRGAALLDALDELQTVLLGDHPSPAAVVERLQSRLAAAQEDGQDAVLTEILGAIDLRARVELAKLERDARAQPP